MFVRNFEAQFEVSCFHVQDVPKAMDQIETDSSSAVL